MASASSSFAACTWKAEELNSFRDQIRGRVVCLESALLLLVQSVGVQSVGEALQRLRGVNTKIDVLFGYKTELRLSQPYTSARD